MTLKAGRWSEPIESAYGQHLLYIESRESGVIPSLDAMSDRIVHKPPAIGAWYLAQRKDDA